MFIGHTTNIEYGNISGILKIWIYSFHMPLFFFLSGYVFSFHGEGYKTFLIKKIKSLIIPLISFSIIHIIFDLIYYNFLLNNSEYSLKIEINKLIGIVFQQRSGVYGAMLWFIPCLFVAENIFYWICRLTKNNNTFLMMFISAVSLYFMGVLFIKKIGILLPWCIEISMIAVLFITLGYILKQNIRYIYIYILSDVKVSIIFFLINIILALINYNISGEMIDLIGDRIGNPVLFPLSALSGIIGFIILFKNQKRFNIIQYIGRNSLIFYGIGGMMAFVPNILIYNILHTNFIILGNAGVLVSIIFAFIQCAVTYPIVELFNKRLKFMLGKF